MIPTVGCHTARALLESFVDGELIVEEQVLVESHLRGCQTCMARVEDLRLIGSGLRMGAWAGQETVADAELLRAAQDDARGRAAAERDQSVGPWLRETFADMRLLWPAIGASFAVAASVGIVFGVLHAASAERPESLAAMIESLADPGSDRNPLRLDSAIMIPRVVGNGIALDEFGGAGEDAVFAVATVVTREGRIGNYELLESAFNEPSGRASTRTSMEEMLGAVRHSRFAPAQAPGGRVVAVNMVWLFARTTVKASLQPVDLTVPLSDPSRAVPAVERPRAPVAVPAAADAPAEGGSNSPNDSTTA